MKAKVRILRRGVTPLVGTALQRGVERANGHEAVSTDSCTEGKIAKAVQHPREQNTALKLGANEKFGDWLAWQLVDSAFPTGGFAHSSGLEAAWQHGEVRNRIDLDSFLIASLSQLGSASLPFVTAAFDAPEELAEFDSHCDVFTTNHVANRASRLQGRALFAAVERTFNLEFGTRNSELKFFHFAPVFGAGLRGLGISRETTMRMFFFNQLRGVLAAAVRLNIAGPMEAQMLHHRFSPQAEAVLKCCEAFTLDDIAQTAPLLDLWSGAQDRLYSRLFQS